jgi:hypothetical protein
MANGGVRSLASDFLFLNLIMYVVVAVIAGWAINYSIEDSANSRKPFSSTAADRNQPELACYICVHVFDLCSFPWMRAVKGAAPPVRLFPIYFPIGNLATGFFVIFALLASAVGIATSLTGLRDVTEGYPASMMSATASAIVTWTLTLLAMG